MRVLIIKLSSMGDLMHALPALTDVAKVYPDIEFDWVVDQAFAEVPLWHPNVKRVIKTAHRRWRKKPVQAFKDGQLSAFYHELNAQKYDAVIDLQGNIKSALVSWLHKGKVHGLNKQCCRERIAHFAYQYQYQVDKDQHAIGKLRELMAKVLNYPRPTSPIDYGVTLENYSLPELSFAFADKYLLFIHNASWLAKLWPVTNWQQLVKKAADEGYAVLLPCGNEQEYQRAQQIAVVSEQAYALPRLPLNAVAALISHAQGAVCSDTGLANLAAVAKTPAVTLYGATDPRLIGTYGENQHHIESGSACSPCYKRQCSLMSSEQGQPVCMAEIAPDQVWHRLKSCLPAQ